MAIHPKIAKALLLLDRDRTVAAEEALREALRDAEDTRDETNATRARCILGELLHAEGRDAEARPLLEVAAAMVRDDDVLDHEIARGGRDSSGPRKLGLVGWRPPLCHLLGGETVPRCTAGARVSTGQLRGGGAGSAPRSSAEPCLVLTRSRDGAPASQPAPIAGRQCPFAEITALRSAYSDSPNVRSAPLGLSGAAWAWVRTRARPD